MTSHDDLDRLLLVWFETEAPRAEPEHLLERILGRTARTPRRRTWRLLEGINSMQATMRVPTVPREVILFPIALLIAIIAIALVAAGAERHLPSPFGVAKPGLIAYENDGDIILANADGSGKIVLAAGPTYGFDAQWSRDGARLAYWSAANWDKPATLTVVKPDGGSPVEVVSGVVAPGQISWSPDGKRIVFPAQVDTASRLMVADIGRTGARPLGDASVVGSDPVWSPDGRTIAFKGGSTYKDGGVYLVGADGSYPHRLSQVPGTTAFTDVDWSPDSRFVTFTAGDDNRHSIWIAAADGSGEHAIAQDPTLDQFFPRWSPDGSRIAFVMSATANASPINAPDVTDVVIVDPDGSDRQQIKTASGLALWSPNGADLILWAPAGNGQDLIPTLMDQSGTSGSHLMPYAPDSWQRLAP